MVDVNVTPDKKTVFLHQEALVLGGGLGFRAWRLALGTA